MSDFKVHQRDGEDVSVIELKGYLDAHTAPDLENAFQKLLTEKKIQHRSQLPRFVIHQQRRIGSLYGVRGRRAQ